MSHRGEETSPGVAARALPRVLLAAYLIALALIALWPTPVDRDMHGLLSAVIRFLNGHGMPWLRYGHVEAAANVALFVPFGVFGTMILRRWWLTALLGVVVAGCIEVAQGLFLPGRVSTPADVVANGVGVTLGALVVVVVRRLSGRGTSGDRGRSAGRRSPRGRPRTP